MEITELDEYFSHQLVEPVAHLSQNDPSWAERLFVGMHAPGQFALHTGVSFYPNNDTVESYAVFKDWADPETQHNIRQSTDLEHGRWPLGAGSLRVDVQSPMRQIRLTCGENPLGLEFDIVGSSRGKPYGCDSVKRYRKGRLAYDNIVAFQPMEYSGEIRFQGKAFPVERVYGHRDRSWGIRTSGEGRIPRGLYLWFGAEFEDVSLMIFTQERQSGEVVRCSGAVTHASDGRAVPIVEFTHELEFDEERQLARARLISVDAEGQRWTLEAAPETTVFMAGAGYTSRPDRRGQLGRDLWFESWDLSDPEVVAEVDGLNDNLCEFTIAETGARGRGVVETLYGEYDPYGLHALPGTEYEHRKGSPDGAMAGAEGQ